MPELEPRVFFLWDQPRLLLDVRPTHAFQKGSLKEAISFPAEQFDTPQRFIDSLKAIKTNAPLHLIDQDGQIASMLLHHIPLDYLRGGYKAYKTWREEAFGNGAPLFVLGGFTGSGKTQLLHRLETAGHPVIDFEQMASHKGSVFGFIQGVQQPQPEQFQNDLLSVWLSLHPEIPVWVEEKGPFLGQAGLPDAFYKKMLNAPMIHLEVPFRQRLEAVLKQYGTLDPSQFRHALRKLETRMGVSQNHKALHYYNIGEREKCFEILLRYYDEAYEKRRMACCKGPVTVVEHSNTDLEATVRKLVTLNLP